MVDPIIIGGAVGAVTITAAAAYSYLTGEKSSAGADIDNDGDDEIGAEFGDSDGDAANNVDEFVEEVEFNIAPDEVLEIKDLSDIKGIGPTRKDNLIKEGFQTAADIWHAADGDLTNVDNIGEYTVEQIREDIGGSDDENTSNPD